jgi:HD superfamily phosphodiesterase
MKAPNQDINACNVHLLLLSHCQEDHSDHFQTLRDNGQCDLDIDLLTSQLHQFCAEATFGRDKSHGVEHMDQVRDNAIAIWKKESEGSPSLNSKRILSLVIAAAQLHDVADHKYGQTTAQLASVMNELQKHFSMSDVELLMSIMDKTSYSKEAKIRKSTGAWPTWHELGEEGRLVRNIVSDADKLEAIGMIGVQRCLQYSFEKDSSTSASQLLDHLVEHSAEKLFLLKDQYIRTKSGKEMAECPHEVMVREVTRLEELRQTNEVLFEQEVRRHVAHG